MADKKKAPKKRAAKKGSAKKSGGKKGKIIAGAAAAATAAAAAGIVAVARKRGGKDAAAYHVLSDGDGWVVRAEGAERATSRHGNKREAVNAGRDLATKKEGSLIIHRLDGTVQRSHSYA